MNRLRLNFSLVTNIERAQFIRDYVSQLTFTPNEAELDLMAKYILWGKDPKTGLNSVQDGTLELPSKYGDWSKTNSHPTESLDGLVESPAFNETSVRSLESTHYIARPQKLNRAEMRRLAQSNSLVLNEFESLWKQIDRLDLQIELYELLIGKRSKEIRDSLISKFSTEDIESFKVLVADWNEYIYLKKRHLLVDLRKQQFELKDSISNSIGYGTPTMSASAAPESSFTLVWELDVPVRPLGLWDPNWDRPNYEIKYDCPHQSLELNFEDPQCWYNVLNAYEDIRDAALSDQIEQNNDKLLKTIDWYIEHADLTDVYAEVLKRKLRKEKNIDIALYINSRFNKKYTENYISTIYTQKVIPKLVDAALFHKIFNQNLNNPSMFKTCICCGRTYLRTADFFVRKARSADGLNNKCKKCDKKIRDERKMIEYKGGVKV